MILKRAAGVLLHLTSLPSRYGIGDMGENALKFIDFLAEGGQSLWQVLPLNPVGYGESPYQAFSAFAGNHLLIDPEGLRDIGLLSPADLRDVPDFAPRTVDYPSATAVKMDFLRRAFRRFQESSPPAAYHRFLEKNRWWLPDYALFMALKEMTGGLPWQQWEEGLSRREQPVLEGYRSKLENRVEFHCFLQYLFWEQWQRLRRYAQSRGVKIIGDLPIFVAADSSDTWTNRSLFQLDPAGNPAKVAGVPPDYFSPTGQRWGNPLYRWELMAEDDYLWWRRRIEHLLEYVDYIRLDHFRGFAAYWEIDAAEKTAVHGRWVQGPGKHFFAVLERYLGRLPIIAEDLGFITADVKALKDAFGFPGMKVLQFLTEEKLGERPEPENVVYYTGTHDNDTLLGWYKKNILSLLDRGQDTEGICWEFIEILYRSNAAWVIIPMQDILGLDSEARMNTPGTLGENWRWRVLPRELQGPETGRLRELARQYHRLP